MLRSQFMFYCSLIVLMTIIWSFRHNTTEFEIALKNAMKNKIELLKVFHHYSEPRDSLKRKAAVFLIENMVHKRSYKTALFANKAVFFESIRENFYDSLLSKSERDLEFKILFDSNKMSRAISNLEIEDNLNFIKSEYLIENIDLAFMAWKTFPWSEDVPFDDFCNYILPYRVFDEPLDNWRKTLMKRYGWVMDSINDPTSLREATILINKHFNANMKYYSDLRPIPNALGFKELDSLKLGKCEHLVMMNIYALRAMGIPAMAEGTVWANHRAGHSWCSIIEKGRPVFAFDPLYPPNISDSLYLKSNFNHVPEESFSKMKAAKIFRTEYKNNYSYLPYGVSESNDVSSLSTTIAIDLTDVTSDYNLPQSKLVLEATSNFKNDVLFLSIFNRDNWTRLVWSEKDKKGRFTFDNLGTGIVYKPEFMLDTIELPPFIFSEGGLFQSLTPKLDDLNTIQLTRKYFTRAYVERALNNVVGGVFQGSNNIDFKDSKDLFKITKSPEPWTNEYYLSNTEAYRYIRYFQPEGYCRVAEMNFYGKLNLKNGSRPRIKAKIINNGYEKDAGPLNIQDQNPLSYFVSDKPNGGWIGIDLGRNNQFIIEKVDFYPPNDGNSIEKGDLYELFYWDKYGKWKSLGRKIANSERILFESCPSDALFILKNQTKGSDARIFTYSDGEQLWW